MKVIDLLNKIAKGEELPKKIKYENIDYSWCNQCKIYERIEDGSIDLYGDLDNLNDEVEIIEDNDDLELIPDDELYELTGFGEKKNNKLNYNFRVLKDKINEIIKDINDIRKEIK